MTRTQTRILTALAIVVGAFALIAFQLSHFAVDATLRHWHDGPQGYQTALALQKSSAKPIALFFHTDWCSSCKKLRETVLSSQKFDQYLKNVIPVKINPEKSAAARRIADNFGVFGYPTFLIIRNDPRSVTPIATSQNLTPEKFIDMCNQAVKI